MKVERTERNDTDTGQDFRFQMSQRPENRRRRGHTAGVNRLEHNLVAGGRRVMSLKRVPLLGLVALCGVPSSASTPFVRIHTPDDDKICWTAGGRADMIENSHVRLPDMRAIDGVELVGTCCSLCHKEPGCVAFTYNRELGVCHLQVRQPVRSAMQQQPPAPGKQCPRSTAQHIGSTPRSDSPRTARNM